MRKIYFFLFHRASCEIKALKEGCSITGPVAGLHTQFSPMSHLQHRYGVPNNPLFGFCEIKWNHTSKFTIASLYTFLFYNIYNFVVFFPFLTIHYSDVLPLEFILFVSLLILFHNFFPTIFLFGKGSKFPNTHTHFSAAKAVADFSLITCLNGVSKEKTDVRGTAFKGQTGQIKRK